MGHSSWGKRKIPTTKGHSSSGRNHKKKRGQRNLKRRKTHVHGIRGRVQLKRFTRGKVKKGWGLQEILLLTIGGSGQERHGT